MAQNAGNFLGPRNIAIYTNDFGEQFRVTIDADVAEDANTGFAVDDATKPELPVRHTMRHVWGVAVESGKKIRKKIPCGTNACAAYQNSVTSLTLDSLSFGIYGRVGEKVFA